jgi:hypothetical protein
MRSSDGQGVRIFLVGVAVRLHLSPVKSVHFARSTGFEVVLFLCDCRDRDGELTIQFTMPAESRAGPWNFPLTSCPQNDNPPPVLNWLTCTPNDDHDHPVSFRLYVV